MIYEVPRDELFLVGTSEVSLAALHAGRDPRRRRAPAPLRRASRPAFGARPAPPARTRAGSSASTSSTRSRCSRSSSPASPAAEHERLLAIQERILQSLEIPYRVVDIPVGDLGAPAARKFDCEGWIPSQERYRELTSTLEHDRLPGAAPRCPLPPRDGEAPTRAPAHAERHRGRGRPHADRDIENRQRRTARSRSRRRWSTPAPRARSRPDAPSSGAVGIRIGSASPPGHRAQRPSPGDR